MTIRWDADLLGPAVRAARRALADMETEMVPHSLAKVVASSARRLPPPLAQATLRELDESESLRASALGCLPSEGSDPRLAASRAFLERRPGWEATLADASAAFGGMATEQLLESARDELDSVRAELKATKHKLTDARRAARTEREALERKLSEARQRLAEVHAAPFDSAADTDKRLREVERREAELRRAFDRSEKTIERLKQELLRARRARTGEPQSSETRGVATDPIGLAKSIDALARAATPGAAADRDGQVAPDGGGPGLVLPLGIAPDHPEAIKWLLEREQPTTLVIDGYNVAWQIQPSGFSSAAVRDDVVRRAAAMRSTAVGPLRVIVVFDSRHGESEPAPPGPVSLRWAENADEEVVRLSAELDGPVVVVSSDREVQDAAGAAGALALWSEAFVGW